MKSLVLCLAAAGAALSVGAAQAKPSDQPALVQSADVTAVTPFSTEATGLLLKTQWAWGGRSYCWYDNGWQGPGFYWCGYNFRRGYGWGGPAGWHGWRGGGWEARGYGYDRYRYRHDWDRDRYRDRGWDHDRDRYRRY